MKHLAWLIFVLCVSGPVLAGPVYRAGQSSSVVNSLLHGELSADYQFSSQKMKLLTGEDETSALKGWNVRALWAPLSWLAVGAEMTRFNDEDLKNFFVSSYKSNRVGGVVKFTLSPNTSPRLYALAGYGRTMHQLNYDHSSILTRMWPGHDKKNISYWMVGLGLELDVWRSVFVGGEGNILFHQSRDLARYYKLDSKTETELRVRVGVHF